MKQCEQIIIASYLLKEFGLPRELPGSDRPFFIEEVARIVDFKKMRRMVEERAALIASMSDKKTFAKS